MSYTFTEIMQIKLNALGYKNAITGYITKPPDFSSDTRVAIANFNKDCKYNNGAYVDKTMLVNLDKAYKKQFPDTPLPNSYFKGWSKKIVYGSKSSSDSSNSSNKITPVSPVVIDDSSAKNNIAPYDKHSEDDIIDISDSSGSGESDSMMMIAGACLLVLVIVMMNKKGKGRKR